jgi:hypothetical protein
MQYGPFYDRSTAGTFTQLKSEVFTGVRYNDIADWYQHHPSEVESSIRQMIAKGKH